MGSIESYTTQAGRRYRVLYRRPDKNPRAIGIINTHIHPRLGPIQIGQFTLLQAQQWAAGIPGSTETVRKVGRRPHWRELGHDRLILLMAYCGLRWGELSGLRIQDLDLPRARLQVKQTVVTDKGYQRIEALKDYEHRSMKIPEFLVTMLEQQVEGSPRLQPVFFGMRTKTYLRNHAFRTGRFDPAATAVGLDGITPHERRNTAASLAVSAGAHVKSVQADTRPCVSCDDARDLRRPVRRRSGQRGIGGQ